MFSFMNDPTVALIVATIIKGAILIFILLTAFAYMTLIERRVVAKMQGRLGPNRAGPFGLLRRVPMLLKRWLLKSKLCQRRPKKAFILSHQCCPLLLRSVHLP